MISVLTLHYEFNKQINRINSDHLQNINAIDIDSYLNHAKDITLQRYDEIVEKNRVVENHLRQLEKFNVKLVLKKTGDKYNTYTLPKEYYNYLRVESYACCIDCDCKDDQLLETTTYTQLDDLNESLKSPHKRPDWNWRRVIYNFTEDGLMVYHNGKYTMKDVLLSFIRWIPDVAAVDNIPNGNYVRADGESITKNIDLDINNKHSTLWRFIVQIAVYLYKKDVDSNYRVDIDSILFNENLNLI